MSDEVKHPDITVNLIGQDGNAFAVIGAVTKGLRDGGVSHEEREVFKKEAMSADYMNLLATCARWVNIE